MNKTLNKTLNTNCTLNRLYSPWYGFLSHQSLVSWQLTLPMKLLVASWVLSFHHVHPPVHHQIHDPHYLHQSRSGNARHQLPPHRHPPHLRLSSSLFFSSLSQSSCLSCLSHPLWLSSWYPCHFFPSSPFPLRFPFSFFHLLLRSFLSLMNQMLETEEVAHQQAPHLTRHEDQKPINYLLLGISRKYDLSHVAMPKKAIVEAHMTLVSRYANIQVRH